MNFKIIGDSNFRDLFSLHRDELQSGISVSFDQATSVASVRTILDNPDLRQNAVFVCSPTNEISLKSKNNTKSREGIIESVVKDLFSCINEHATKNNKIIYVICQPFLRLDPPWLEAKLKFYSDLIKTSHANGVSPPNVHIGTEVPILADDLKPDKIHLNSEGIKKLLTGMLGDINIAKELCENGGEMRFEGTEGEGDASMEDVPLCTTTRSTRKTPLRKKRTHDETSDEDGKLIKKKKPKSKEDKLDMVLDKMLRMDQMLKDLHDDRSSHKERIEGLEDKVEETILVQQNLKEQIETIKQGDNTFTATIKEDLDAVENANLRDTVIIKKMATDKTIPTDRKELSTLILEVGKELLTEVLGTDKGMKYIAPLYFRNDKRPLKEGDRLELPPFKITFKHLTDAVDFKEKVIAASKITTHRLYKCYATSQQTVSTRIRLMVLWGIVDVLKKEKKESWVNQSAPKPTLQVKQTGTLIKSYSYIEAISAYGERIEKKVIDEATKLAGRFFYGQVEKIFIILKD